MEPISQEDMDRLEEQMHAQLTAETFLMGNLIKAATRQLKELAMPFSKLDQEAQDKVLERVHEDISKAVLEAVNVIATGNRIHFRTAVKSVQFVEDEVKVQLTCINSIEAHHLANKAGGVVMVVIEDGNRYLEVGDALEGEPDQHALFDTSTAGSGWQDKEAA